MINQISDLAAADIGSLVRASRQEGFRFLTRLCDEWANGSNVFNGPGEALFGVFDDAQLVGIGGINRQDDATGRLRRFYILPSRRRLGFGRSLLNHILAHAAAHFRWVVLRTDSATADLFYCACGFTRVEDVPGATHRIRLARAEPVAGDR